MIVVASWLEVYFSVNLIIMRVWLNPCKWFLFMFYDGRCIFWPEIEIISWYVIPTHKYANPCLLCINSIDIKTCIYSLYVIQITIKMRPLYATPLKCRRLPNEKGKERVSEIKTCREDCYRIVIALLSYGDLMLVIQKIQLENWMFAAGKLNVWIL